MEGRSGLARSQRRRLNSRYIPPSSLLSPVRVDGRLKQKVLPPPILLTTQIRPP
jgi:hypothetical protein